MLRPAALMVLAGASFALAPLLRALGAQALVAWLFVEDGLIEGLGAAALAAGGVLLVVAAVRYPAPSRAARTMWLLFGLLLLVMCGEEINWGQRLLGFGTPDWLRSASATEEFNLHNLRQFQTGWNGNRPTSWWQLGTLGLLVIVPLAARLPAVRQLCDRLGLGVASAPIAWTAAGVFLGMLLAGNYGLAAENSEWQELLLELLLLAWAVQVVRPYAPAGAGPGLLPAGAALLLIGACAARLATLDAVSIQRGRAVVYASIAANLLASGDRDQARAHVAEALTIDPRSAAAHYLLGMLELQADRTPEAIAALEQALVLDPQMAEAHYGLAIALAGAGRYGEARAALEAALRIKPEMSEARDLLEKLRGA